MVKIDSLRAEEQRSGCTQLPEFSPGTFVGGTLLLKGSRLVFFTSRDLVHIFLARHLQPTMYGVWGLVLGLLTIYRMILMRDGIHGGVGRLGI